MRLGAALNLAIGALVGGLVLAALAHFINPCIGATRYEPCVSQGAVITESATEQVADVRSCYAEGCTVKRSPTEQMGHLAVVCLVLVLVGASGARRVRRSHALAGAVAAGLAVLLGVAATTYLYPYGPNATSLVASALRTTVAVLFGSAVGAFGAGGTRRLTPGWIDRAAASPPPPE